MFVCVRSLYLYLSSSVSINLSARFWRCCFWRLRFFFLPVIIFTLLCNVCNGIKSVANQYSTVRCTYLNTISNCCISAPRALRKCNLKSIYMRIWNAFGNSIFFLSISPPSSTIIDAHLWANPKTKKKKKKTPFRRETEKNSNSLSTHTHTHVYVWKSKIGKNSWLHLANIWKQYDQSCKRTLSVRLKQEEKKINSARAHIHRNAQTNRYDDVVYRFCKCVNCDL